jgi:hypothetical protein
MRSFILAVLALVSFTAANAQQLASSVRVAKMTSYHATVGTATAAAIPAASIGGNAYSWKICNDAVNTSTYLLVGQAVDVSTDGSMLGLGQCLECENCTAKVLEGMKVEGQAAANGYSVIVYRQ